MESYCYVRCVCLYMTVWYMYLLKIKFSNLTQNGYTCRMRHSRGRWILMKNDSYRHEIQVLSLSKQHQNHRTIAIQ